jgi:hypothetical protein
MWRRRGAKNYWKVDQKPALLTEVSSLATTTLSIGLNVRSWRGSRLAARLPSFDRYGSSGTCVAALCSGGSARGE